jgi:Protein of unknown function (DUF3302)
MTFDVLDLFALVVLTVLFAAVVIAIVALGALPGAIARKRGHPQAAAVNVASWLGLVSGILWPLALIWAFWKPSAAGAALAQQPGPAGNGANAGAGPMEARMEALEVTVRKLQTGKEGR